METSADKIFYDQTEEIDLDQHKKWMEEIKFYFNAYSSQLNNALSGTSGIVIELGAGSCGLSISLTKLQNVKQVYSFDISMNRMKHMIEISNKFIDGHITKIEVVEGDFNHILPFDDNSIDAILFDASLHHTRSIWNTLAECKRILKPNGMLIAQRESFLNPFRAKKQLNNLLKSPEVLAQVSENMYLKEQYEYYLKVYGFDVDFLPASPNRIKTFLMPFNGLLFTSGVFICQKK